MLFNSYEFLLFFPLVTLIYFLVPSAKFRRVWLLVSSYFFYMCWEARYALLILFITVVTYLAGIVIASSDSTVKRRIALVISFASCLSVLFVFKYIGFVVDTMNSILHVLNVTAIDNKISLILPVGISFYTFQALSYTVDVYRKETSVEKNFLRYALFVSFFPQLVAGPIERSKNLISQINEVPEKKNLWNSERILAGFYLMLWGMFVKVVIADRISKISDAVFDSYYRYGRFGLIFGSIAFSIQIYCDFSAYSTIAIGAAKVMGFTLMDNFNTPYFSMTIKEFWRRWHISLSTWFRDYLYIPLGGNRCSKARKYFNLFITFLVSGLWHGANWTYVVWGGLHGIYQIVGEVMSPLVIKIEDFLEIKRDRFSYKLGRMLGTFMLADVAWIFFRASTIKDALGYIARMIKIDDSFAIFDCNAYDFGISHYEMNILFIALLVMLAVSIMQYIGKSRIDDIIVNQNIVFKTVVIFIFVMAILIYGMYGPELSAEDFIYFQF